MSKIVAGDVDGAGKFRVWVESAVEPDDGWLVGMSPRTVSERGQCYRSDPLMSLVSIEKWPRHTRFC